MKKVLLCFVSFLCLTACSSTPEQRFVGADKDAHGCIASAGYTWSEARQECIRVWKEGIKITSLAEDGTQGYIILSADGTQAEVFLPVKTKPVLLKRAFSQDGPFWKGDDNPWLLKRLPLGWKLYQGSRLQYEAPNP